MAVEKSLAIPRDLPRGSPPVERAGRPGAPSSGRRIGRKLFWCWFVTLVGCIHVLGLQYYLAPIGERVRSPFHAWLKPSGFVGQAAGIVTFLLFLFMWLYPLRKRFPFLARFGSMAGWLDVHIAAGLMVPVLGAVHAAWRFQGVIGLGYASMFAVCLSGVVGRYLYTHIPRGRDGVELSLEDIRARRTALAERIARQTRLPIDEVKAGLEDAGRVAPSDGWLRAVLALVRGDLDRWRATRRLRRRWIAVADVPIDRRVLREVTALARREIALGQQRRLLRATHRIFRFWHIAHRPFAITALIAVTVHVVVVVALGVTWFR